MHAVAPDLQAMVDGTAEPAFAVDATRTIIAWNRAAERLFDLPATEAVGRSCCQVIAARDLRGRLVCGTLCPAFLAMRRKEALGAIELQVVRAGPAPVWISMSTVIPADGTPWVFHLIRDLTGERNRRAFVQQVLEAAMAIAAEPGGPEAAADAPPVVLSPRQTTILRLLASGASTRAIARSLGISTATVRNHVQQILTALHAHSRLEAVAQALRRGLV